MIVECPNCKTTYELSERLLGNKTRKLRCSNCGKVFVFSNLAQKNNESQKTKDQPQGADIPLTEQKSDILREPASNNQITDDDFEDSQNSIEENHISQNDDNGKEDLPQEDNTSTSEENDSSTPEDDSSNTTSEEESDEASDQPKEEEEEDDVEGISMQKIFQRLSQKSKDLETIEQHMSFKQKILEKWKLIVLWNTPRNRALLGSLFVTILLLVVYTKRFDITRAIPFCGHLYDLVGIESRVVGEGLSFNNVTRRDYEIDNINHMEILGYIDNTLSHPLQIPTLHVEILDKDGKTLQHKDYDFRKERIMSGERKPFRVDLTKPSVLGKYVYITFIK